MAKAPVFLTKYFREKGKLPSRQPIEITIYSRPGCDLCEEAKIQMAPLLEQFGARLVELNIDVDPALRELYDLEVPVIFLEGRKIAKHRIDLKQLGRQLAAARNAKNGPGG